MKTTFAITAMALAGVLSGCTDSVMDTPAEAAPRSVASAAAVPAAAHSARPGEQAVRALSRQFPEVGGLHVDENGNLVVHAVELSRGNAIRGAVRSVVAQLDAAHGKPGRKPAEVVLRKSDYTFVQLDGWREGTREALFALGDVALIDVDERANRLVVGLRDGSGRAASLAVLRRAGVPDGAVMFDGVDQEEPFDPSTSTSFATGCATLRSLCRPLVGGVMTVYARDGSYYQCTIGFTALSGGQTRFVTAAHCSDDEWSTDGTVYHQPQPNNAVGTEVYDPRGWSCGFLSAYVCRYSDANLVAPSVAADVGYIARPSGLGSLQTDPQNPRFAVSAQRDAYVGEQIYAIGRTTGMVIGTVDKTCADFKKTWNGRYHAVLCSDVGTYNSSGGDSGGPVVIWNGSSNRVTLVGVNYARNGLYDHAFYSPMSGIQRDLGSLEARAPEYRGTSGGGSGGDGGCSTPSQPGVGPVIVEPC
jgi:hypothetical protein